MSCPLEATLVVWLDGELEAEDRRELEIHLVGCQACRARVLALRDESDWLTDALLDREPPGVTVREPVAPARGVAIGLVPAAVLVAAVLAGIGALLESVPSAFEWMNPFQTKGATEMLFKVIFTIRDEAPALLQLALAVAATAGLSAVLTFALNAIARRTAGPGAFCLAVLVFAFASTPSEAHFGMHEHEDFDLAASESHDGTLIVSAATANVDGLVDGDLIVFAERFSLRGEVRGNVFSMSETTDLGGRIDGSAYVGGDRIEITGRVDGHLYAGAEQLEIARSGAVDGDAVIWTADGIIEGEIGRDLYTAGKRVEIRGAVARNVLAHRVRLALRDGAEIGGDVTARLADGEEVRTSPGAVVRGVVRTDDVAGHGRMLLERYRSGAFYVFLAVQLVAAFLFGMVLRVCVPRVFDNRLETAGDFFRAMGIGVLTMVAAPIVLLLTAVTLVGLPLALLGFVLYAAAVYASTIVVAALVGAALVKTGDSSMQSFGLALLAGLAAVMVLAHLPFFGWPVHLVVWFVGVGLMVDRARAAWGRRTARSGTV